MNWRCRSSRLTWISNSHEKAHGGSAPMCLLLVFLLLLLSLVAEHGFARKLDLISFQADDLDHNLIAFLEYIPHVANAALIDFRDVKQAIRSRKNLDERTKIGNAYDFSTIRLSDFGSGGQVRDDLDRLLGRRTVSRRDVHAPVIGDVDLYTGLFDDRADHFSAGSDHIADFVGWDLH